MVCFCGFVVFVVVCVPLIQVVNAREPAVSLFLGVLFLLVIELAGAVQITY